MNGIIFDLKRFAVHDGSGIRSTLFLKGCPLRCPWCQNPEGLDLHPQLWYTPSTCLHCSTCIPACPSQALSVGERIHINRSSCTLCGACVEACPTASLTLCGQTVTAQEAAGMLLRDRVFFGDNGGITLSGGEVLMQWQFAAEVLRLCKAQGADTAIESCLLAPQHALEAVAAVTDHFLIDLKILDRSRHRQILGADNQQILDNYRWLLRQSADVLVRTPLIPGYTATDDNIRSIAAFVHAADPQARYELLNFNPLCRSKYAALEQDYPIGGGALSAEQMEHFYKILAQEGISQIIKE